MGTFLDRRHVHSPTVAELTARFLAAFAHRVAEFGAPATSLATYRSAAKLFVGTPDPEAAEMFGCLLQLEDSYLRAVVALRLFTEPAAWPHDLRSRHTAALMRQEIRTWHRALAERRNPRDGERLTGAADNALRTLHFALNWAVHEDVLALEDLPTRGIRHLHKGESPRAFADGELERFREALKIHERVRTRGVRGLSMGHPRLVAAFTPTVLLRLLDLTGARVTEIRTLRVEQVCLERGMILLAKTKSGRGQARPLSDDALTVIRQHIARLGSPTSGWMFPGQYAKVRDKAISDVNVQRVFREVLAVAEIDHTDNGMGKLTRHSLRHTVVTNAFHRRFRSAAIAGMCGQTKEHAFKRYRQALPGDAWDVAEAHAQHTDRYPSHLRGRAA